jgi:hypothetical protein
MVGKRIKPVIEEIVETKLEEPRAQEEVVKEVPKGTLEVIEKAEAKEGVKKDSRAEPKKMNLKLVVTITLVSALVAAFVSGGVYVYLSGVGSSTKAPEVTPTPSSSPTSEATPTPEPEAADVSEYSVQVLNGSGAIGAASAGEDILSEAGFKVGATGNAKNYDFEETVIQVKDDVPGEVVNIAKKALEESEYEVKVGETLPDSSKYDMVVTIGPS